MQITPIEIRQKRFEKKFRGYHTDEVDAFLYSLAHMWEKLTTQSSELKIMLEVYKQDLKRLEGLEDALLKNIQVSDVTATHIVEQATRESELILQEASLEAQKLLYEAKTNAQAIEEKSRHEAKQHKESLDKELIATRLAVQETINYKVNMAKILQDLGQELLEKNQLLQNIPPIEQVKYLG